MPDTIVAVPNQTEQWESDLRSACDQLNEKHRRWVAAVVSTILGWGGVGEVARYPLLDPIRKALGDWGKVTLPEVTQTSPWVWIVGLIVVAAVVFWFLERPRGGAWGQRYHRRAAA